MWCYVSLLVIILQMQSVLWIWWNEKGPDTIFSCLFADADVISSQLADNPITLTLVIFLRTSIRLYLDSSSIWICKLTQLAMEQSPSTAPMFSGDVRRFSGLVWKWTRCVYNVAPLLDEAGNYRSVSHSTFQNKTSVFQVDQIIGGKLKGGCWIFTLYIHLISPKIRNR